MSKPSQQSAAHKTLTILRGRMTEVCSRDVGRLLSRLGRLQRERSPDARRVQSLADAVDASIRRRRQRAASTPVIQLDDALPIAARSADIIAAIRGHQVVVIAGETGSGKTTQLPKLCLAAGRGEAGLVGCTQPRRLAARSVARRVAEEMHTQIGGLVGFQVRFTEQVGEDARIKFMTDGILLVETQSDPWLSAYDTLIIDEAHERSLNIDFLLGYLKRLAARRPDLKIIITSATIDTSRFAAHFGDAPVIEVEGRAYPVEVRWRAPAGRGEVNVADQVVAAVDEISAEDPHGDVLVFLPGEREIRDVHRALSHRQYRHTEVLPLYARLSARDQDRVFKPGRERRVVLATNVAETSLTVPRIRYVVDAGTARVKRYSQRRQLERLHVEPISRAAADQRKGRCGRVGPGICVRLYDEADYTARPRFTEPELLRSSLANVILRMLSLKLGEVEDFPFLDAPEPRAIADGYRRLGELQAIDEKRHLTAIGRTLGRLPIDAQLARMLVEGDRLGVLPELIVLVAFLSVQDPRERPADARQQADQAHAVFIDPKSDFVGICNLWRAYAEAHEELTQSKLRGWCQRHFLSFMRMREWRELHRQLLLVTRDALAPETRQQGADENGTGDARAASTRRLRGAAKRVESVAKVSGSTDPRSQDFGPEKAFESIHCSLLAGLPTQVARKDRKGLFRGPRERSFHVFPGSALAKSPPNWVFSAQILDVGERVWGMLCARIEPQWIERQAAHLLRVTCSDAHWSRKRGQVVAYEQVTLFGLVLVERRAVTFHQQDPALAHAIFLRDALARCDIDARADFIQANARVLREVQDLEAKQRREGLLKSDADLAQFFRDKLPGRIAGSRALDAWYRKAAPAAQAALRWSLDDVLDMPPGLDAAAFPAVLEVGDQRYRLQYRFVPGDAADGVTLQLPLAFLNALPAERCQWLVPGLLGDKVAALIRGLPKALRRNFVPAPDFARAFIESAPSHDMSLAEALAAFLERTTGVDIGAEAFAEIALPEHLRMRFSLRDAHGKELSAGRDMQALREQWRARARDAFSRAADAGLAREDIGAWDFDAIPRRLQSEGGIDAYPALVDLGQAAALRVFERIDAAAAEHPRGVRRLLHMALAGAIKRARRQLPIGSMLALKYAPMGSIDGLREDLVDSALTDLLATRDLDVRTRDAFQALESDVGTHLFAAAMQRLELAEPVIEAQAELKSWLEPPLMGFAPASYDDMREQLDALLAAGFLHDLPADRLRHLPRYLKAMQMRAERLRQDPCKDQQRMLEVMPYWRAWLRLKAEGRRGESLDALRWMIEEWRVSLFAQELKTAQPVSPKRLARALKKAESEGRSG